MFRLKLCNDFVTWRFNCYYFTFIKNIVNTLLNDIISKTNFILHNINNNLCFVQKYVQKTISHQAYLPNQKNQRSLKIYANCLASRKLFKTTILSHEMNYQISIFKESMLMQNFKILTYKKIFPIKLFSLKNI